MDPCILKFVSRNEDVSGTKCKDDEDTDKVQEWEKVQPSEDLVHKVRQWETQDDL